MLSATLRFLDTTPLGRLIARFTQDMRDVDITLAVSTRTLMIQSATLLAQLSTIVLFTPFYVIPGLALAAATYILGRIYMAAQLSVKRFASLVLFIRYEQVLKSSKEKEAMHARLYSATLRLPYTGLLVSAPMGRSMRLRRSLWR